MTDGLNLMRMTRRSAIKLLAAGAVSPALTFSAEPMFKGTWESLKQYRCPEWFRDAKFGILAHWGPQGAPKQGDWYARNMYIQGSRQNKYHVENYGHPSKFGYKNIVPLWKAENWEPETLIRRYKKAGAKYFVSLGVHCDNFDCWDSKYHRWNAAKMGPKRDVVGTWRKLARRYDLRFGVTEHLAWSYDWFNVNKGVDKTGPYVGVPYDGNDPKYWDLYFKPHPEHEAAYPLHPSTLFKRQWFERVKDLVDQNQPDLVYTDGGAFDEVGLQLIAHYYNANMHWHGGKLDGVYTLKNHLAKTKLIGNFEDGAATEDIERGVAADIRPEPWHSETCIGNWFYWEGYKYKEPGEVIYQLLDVVSKNGTMLLNFPLLPDGTLDTREESILEDITAWMAVNGEGIFSTRPWKKYGEGPTEITAGSMNESERKPFTSADFRFTSKGEKLFAFCMGWPEGDFGIASLGTASGLWPRKIEHVRLLGSEEQVRYSRTAEQLLIHRPNHQPCNFAVAFEIQ
jgi:alpha-L-fucosidase